MNDISAQCPVCRSQMSETIYNGDERAELRYLLKILAIDKPFKSIQSYPVRSEATHRALAIMQGIDHVNLLMLLIEMQRELEGGSEE